MRTILNHPDILIGSLFAVLFLYTAGFLLIRTFLHKCSVAYHMVLALPVGIFAWAVIWILTELSMGSSGFGFYNNVNVITLTFISFSIPALLLLNIKRTGFSSSEITHFLFGTGVLIILTLYFFVKGWMVVSGDSYFFLNWSHDPVLSLELGFPIVLPSIANLSTLIGPDYFLYIIFPLTTLSLILLIVLTIENICNKYFFLTEPRLKYLFMIIVILIYSMNPMVHLMMAYANHHSLFAILILTLIILPFLIQKFHFYHYIFIGFLSLSASLLRMEGFIFSMMLLSILAYRFQDKLNVFKLLLISFLFSLPYLAYLTIVLWDDGFVDGKQYLLILMAGLIIILLSGSKKFAELLKERDPGIIAISFLGLILLIVTLLEPVHMGQSLIMFIRNALTPGAWGALNILLLLLVPILIFIRLIQSEKSFNYDFFLHTFVISVLMIFILIYFRSPLRVGRFDSANRMLFHFIPLITIWTSIELAKIISLKSKKE